MKIQIRRGVFETNSSSTHSLQIASSIDDARDMISNRINELYSNKTDEYECEINPKITKGVYQLRGIDLESSNEESCVYYIIDSWENRLEYLAMIVYNTYYYFEGYDKGTYLTEKIPNIMDNKVYQTFLKKATEFVLAKNKYPDVSSVCLDFSHIDHAYFSESNCDIIKRFSEAGEITCSDIEELFDTIMSPDNVIVFCDEAYSPYEKPSIYTI